MGDRAPSARGGAENGHANAYLARQRPSSFPSGARRAGASFPRGAGPERRPGYAPATYFDEIVAVALRGGLVVDFERVRCSRRRIQARMLGSHQ